MEKQQIHRTKYYIAALLLTVVCVVFDQLTKLLAIRSLKGQTPFVIIKDVFQLEYLENRVAAFGMLQNQRIFFFISVVIISILIIAFFLRVPMNRHFLPLCVCAMLIEAGAIGNCIDRLRYGYVVDFLYFKLIDFPIFNVADIYVTVGTFLLAILILFFYKEDDFERILHS